MKNIQSTLLSIIFILLTVISYAQSPVYSCRRAFDPEGRDIAREQYDDTYRRIYVNFQKDIYAGEPIGIEIKGKNSKYRKIRLYPDYIRQYEMNQEMNMVTDLKSPNSGRYTYLYIALVELAPDTQGNKKEQVLLFFSGYNIRAKKKWDTDPKTAYEKEIAADIDKNPIVLTETQPDVFLEVNQYYDGDTSPKIKVFGTTTYIYDINSLHPNKTPLVIGKLFEYKPNLQSIKNYETGMLVNYHKNGKVSGTTEYIPKEGGKTLMLEHIKKFNENGQLTQAGFEISTGIKTGEKYMGNYTYTDIYTNKKFLSFGMDLQNNNTYYTTIMRLPTGIEKNWKRDIHKFNTTPNILTELRENIGREPIEDMEQLREFLTNFQKLNEYTIFDETKKNVHGAPVKYIYKGTYNKEGVPHGWGLMYATNQYDDEYFLGHFKNGMPDGFGIRHDFKLDKPEVRYNSQGLHVGNMLVYGIKHTGTANNNGYNVDYGDFRQGELNGIGSHIWYQGDNGVGMLYYGNFQDGKLHGTGSYFYNDKKEVGEFENGKFVSGSSTTDKRYDNRFSPGEIVIYQGKKYVIMNKENNGFLFDDGTVVSTKADVTLTGERSVQSKICQVCNGTGFLNPTTNTVFSSVTKKEKSYEIGPTGYILWEKTTTKTIAPVATHRTNRCTACTGGLAGYEPVPLRIDQR